MAILRREKDNVNVRFTDYNDDYEEPQTNTKSLLAKT